MTYTLVKKSESNPHILKDDFRKLQSRNYNYQQVHTDESKEDSKAVLTVISDNHSNIQSIINCILQIDPTSLKIPFSNFKPSINTCNLG